MNPFLAVGTCGKERTKVGRPLLVLVHDYIWSDFCSSFSLASLQYMEKIWCKTDALLWWSKPLVLLLPTCSHSLQWCLLISAQAYFLHYEKLSWCHAMICRIDIGSATILHLGNLELTCQFSKHKASKFVLNRVYWNEMLRASQTWPSIVGLYLYKRNSVSPSKKLDCTDSLEGTVSWAHAHSQTQSCAFWWPTVPRLLYWTFIYFRMFGSLKFNLLKFLLLSNKQAK